MRWYCINSRDEIILKKIIQYSDEISATIERFSLTSESFTDDFVAKNAISMCILQIGELVGNLSEDFKSANNAMPWRDIKAITNRLTVFINAGFMWVFVQIL